MLSFLWKGVEIFATSPYDTLNSSLSAPLPPREWQPSKQHSKYRHLFLANLFDASNQRLIKIMHPNPQGSSSARLSWRLVELWVKLHFSLSGGAKRELNIVCTQPNWWSNFQSECISAWHCFNAKEIKESWATSNKVRRGVLPNVVHNILHMTSVQAFLLKISSFHNLTPVHTK